MSLLARITVDPSVCHGKPVIRGLRYPVESMLDYLAAGDSIDDLLAEFPGLEREDPARVPSVRRDGHQAEDASRTD